MNKNFETRKNELLKEILISWRETLIEDDGDEKVKQYLRAATPTLRVFITIQVFEERAKFFSDSESLVEIRAAIDVCKRKLEKQYELGELFINNGFYFKTSEKNLEYSAERLKESLEKAVSDAHIEYSQKSLEHLRDETSTFMQAIEMLSELYD